MAKTKRTRRLDELDGIEFMTSEELLRDLGLELTMESCIRDLFGDLLEHVGTQPEEPEMRVTQAGPPRRDPKQEPEQL